MAVTRRVHICRPNPQVEHNGGWQTVDKVTDECLSALAPAERIVSTLLKGDYLYIFTESFGLGPKGVP